MKTKMIITIEGGLIQEIISNQDVEILIVDYDIDGMEDEKLSKYEGKDCYKWLRDNNWTDATHVHEEFEDYLS